MKTTYFVLFTILLLLAGCSTDPNVQDLEKAAKSVEQMVSRFNAPRLSFFVVCPNGTARQFVSWYFSSLGSADWAPTDREGEFDSDELDALRQSGMALRPAGVYYRHSKPDTAVQKQVVLKWDDAEGIVIIEGYVDPNQEPVVTRSFKIPKGIVPDEAARLITQSNLELGMTYQSF